MTRPRPVRIVTVPGRSVPEVREQVGRAGAAGADLVEIRVDRLEPTARSNLADLFPSPVPLLGTYRSSAEGGDGSDVPEVRGRVLDELRRLGFSAVDREGRRDPSSRSGPKEIVSYHLPSVPDTTDLRRLLLSVDARSWFVKVVAPASLGELIEGVLPGLPAPGESSYVMHTTGASGPLLRAWAGRLGMSAVYCALPQKPQDTERVEASQIPVDRVVRVQEGVPPGRLFALLGHPVSGSASPEIHSAWFERGHRAGLYVALDAASEAEFESTVRTLAASGFSGVNVTRPWKVAAVAVSDTLAPTAESAGCANTLSFRGGEVRAENTDVLAVHRRLKELQRAGRWNGDRFTVVGAGGAARACLAASRALGSEVTVLARRPGEADRLAREYGFEPGRWESPRRTALVVNATPVGGPDGGELPATFAEWVEPGGYLLDFVYAPERPTVARAAAKAGAGYEDGWRLLVYQAAESHAIWWGQPVADEWIEQVLPGGTCTA